MNQGFQSALTGFHFTPGYYLSTPSGLQSQLPRLCKPSLEKKCLEHRNQCVLNNDVFG